QGEIERLQAGLDAAIETMRRLGGDELPNGHDTALASAEKMWTGVKRQAEQVGHEIEQRPLVSAVAAFGIGMAIGLLFRGRRG
ncbi:MAG TPA: hypothetical protein VMF86_04220, partial [Stellaceae bacterium]|nr:hypothetical protein [Stellaceae bacterium]